MNSNSPSNRHTQSREELEQHLREQIEFLRNSAKSFDDGYEGESKRIAATARVLLHENRQSKSLLLQLAMKDLPFWDTSAPLNQDSLVSHSGLVVTVMNKAGAKYQAFLDGGFAPPRQIKFEDWWNQVIFVDSDKRTFTRRELVLAVANKDGGAHIDPALDIAYAELTRKNSLGWVFQQDNGPTVNMVGPEKSALRQICHEILKTLIPGYVLQPKYPEDSVIVGGMTMVAEANSPPSLRCPHDSGVSTLHRCSYCS
ncbi:TPA: hypothetical protein QEL11_001276 [Stenotrophomonas maltophilia]|uniref:hypothetical protein n=1 Tax=Stenotrophomonas maltophilia TaxID=40324 RepID=UPI0031B99EFF|nr:hypothetical protein [Stenotrophomonas maltophilia]